MFHSPVAKPQIFEEPCNTVRTKFLLLFAYLRGVLFKNLNDATRSSLGNPPNMQIKTAITGNPSFVNISVAMHDIKIILSIPMFWGVKNKIKPIQ